VCVFGMYLNSAYDFDGVDDYIEIANNSLFSIQDSITVSAWIKANSYGHVVNKWKTESGWEGSWILGIGSGGYPYFTISEDGWSGELEATAQNPIELSSLYHFAGVYTGSDNMVRFFLNGVETGSILGQSGSIFVSNSKIIIGAAKYVESYTDGIIDDVRIYDRALSPTEICELSESGSCGTTWSTTPPAEASTIYGTDTAHKSNILNLLSILLVPMSAVIIWRIMRRKR